MEESKFQKVSLKDGLLTYIILATSIFFILVIMALFLINMLDVYNTRFEDYIYALDDLQFYLIISSFILVIILILFLNLNKHLKLLPGNEERNKVFKRTIIAALIPTSLVGVLSHAAFGTLTDFYYGTEYATSYYGSVVMIFIFCWLLFFITLQSLISIPKVKKYILLSILILYGFSPVISSIILYDGFNFMLWNDSFEGISVGIVLWTIPFIFCSLTIGVIGLYGVKNTWIRQIDFGRPHFKRTTEVFLIASLPVVYLPQLAVYIHRYYLFYTDIVFFGRLTFIAVLIILLIWLHNFIRRKREERRLNIKSAGSISLRSELLKDRKGIVSFVTFLIIMSIITSNIYNESGPFYEVDLDRRYSTQAEYNVLKTCESLNYGSYWNKSLYYDRPNDPEYKPEYSEKVLPNFINIEILNFYPDKFEYLEDNDIEREALFHYYAKVYPLGNYEIEYNNSEWAHRLRIFIDDEIILFEPLTLHYLYSEELSYSADNYDLSKDQDNVSFNYNFDNTYLVHMDLGCWEYYVVSREGYHTDFYQIVVMDEEFDVKMIIVDEPYQGIY
jgi:hypothetical protein